MNEIINRHIEEITMWIDVYNQQSETAKRWNIEEYKRKKAQRDILLEVSLEITAQNYNLPNYNNLATIF